MTTILITGAGRGIGFELAKQAVRKGYNVIGSVRSVEAENMLVQKIPEITVVNFDVTDFAAVTKAADAFNTKLDVLINCAGMKDAISETTIAHMDAEDLANVLNANVIAPLHMVQSFLPFLGQSDFPRIINISSRLGASWHVSEEIFGYKVSKAAMNKLSQCMALDLGKEGITTVAMHPGWVQTDMGGDEADITVEESAGGILSVISQLTKEDNGKFINYNGDRWAW